MIRRLIAYFIDWYIVLIVMNTLLVAVAYVDTGTVYAGLLPLTIFEAQAQLPLLLALTGIEVLFYCVIPRYVWPGQTLGKKMLRLRVSTAAGEKPGFARLLARDLVAIVVVEGCFSPLSNFVRNYAMLFVDRDVIQYAVWFSWAVGAFSVLILLLTRGRMLHDVIAGTIVTLVPPKSVSDGAADVQEEAGITHGQEGGSGVRGGDGHGYPVDGSVE